MWHDFKTTVNRLIRGCFFLHNPLGNSYLYGDSVVIFEACWDEFSSKACTHHCHNSVLEIGFSCISCARAMLIHYTE